MKLAISIFLLFFTLNFLNAQTIATDIKLVKYTPEYKFIDGLYIDFESFIANAPIEKTKIIAPHLNRKEYNFIAKLVEDKTIKIYNALGGENEIKTKKLWGFCNNGNVYININDDFSRLPYIGSLSHFVADKLTYQQNTNSPYGTNSYNRYNTYGQQPPSANIEMHQYILDVETGDIKEYTLEAVEVSLMKDPELYDEFISLKRKKKRQQMFLYLRKYNERNPLLLPKR